MPSIQATATIDDDGVVRGLRTMGEEFEEVADQADRASSRFEKYDEYVQETVSVTDRLSDAQEQVAESGKEVISSVGRQADAMRQLETRQKTLNTASSKYNQIIFSSGDLVQDLQFGIKGASNNIAFMAEQFAEVQGSGKSFMQVIKGIGSSLMGPAGLILGIQTLLVLGPKLKEWFTSRTEEAQDLNKELKEASESMVSFSDEIAGFEVETLEQAKNAREELEKRNEVLRDEIEPLEKILNVTTATGARQARLSRQEMQQARSARTRLGLEEASNEQIQEMIASKEQEISSNETLISRVEGMIAQRKAELRLEKALSRTSLERADSESEIAESIGQQLGSLHEMKNEIISESGDLDLGAQLEIPFSEYINSLGDVRNLLEEGAFDSIKKVESALSFLNQAFKEATSEEQRQRIRNLRETLSRMREEMRKGGEEAKTFESVLQDMDKGRILAQALTDQFVKLGEAIGKGENVMKSFGKAALGVLSDIGTAMGKQLIAQGSALIASALIPGQQGNAAAGAKLIAAGSALVAASKSLSSATSEDSGGSSEREESRIEGGGEAGIEGRRFGGPVSGGGLYETHGMGQREFFVPGTDGQVMTSKQLQSATMAENRKQSVNVTTENRLEGEIKGPDLFRLETRLREVRDFKDQYARQ